MKKIVAAGMGMLLALTALCGCGVRRIADFEAEVLEIRDGALLVQTVDSPKAPPYDELLISTDVKDLPRLRMGDRIRICYDGEIAETSPARIRRVYSIERLTPTVRIP